MSLSLSLNNVSVALPLSWGYGLEQSDSKGTRPHPLKIFFLKINVVSCC